MTAHQPGLWLRMRRRICRSWGTDMRRAPGPTGTTSPGRATSKLPGYPIPSVAAFVSDREILRKVAEWPAGMPPLPPLGIGLGRLIMLERSRLVRSTPPDSLGETRFKLTARGAAELSLAEAEGRA